jgi:hypothetical protein
MCDVMMVAGGCHSLLCCGPGSPPLSTGTLPFPHILNFYFIFSYF